MGGKSSSTGATTSNTTNTTNVDRRAVLQDAAYVGDGSTSSINFTNYSTDGQVLTSLADTAGMVFQTLSGDQADSVKALTQMGATVIKDAGGAVVDLNRDSITANTKAWDSTLNFGADTVDRIIDSMSESYGMAAKNIEAGYALAGKAVDSFTPTENKNSDVAKYAVIAVGVVALIVFMEKSN